MGNITPKFMTPQTFAKKYCGEAAALHHLNHIFKPRALENAAVGQTEFLVGSWGRKTSKEYTDMLRLADKILKLDGWITWIHNSNGPDDLTCDWALYSLKAKFPNLKESEVKDEPVKSAGLTQTNLENAAAAVAALGARRFEWDGNNGVAYFEPDAIKAYNASSTERVVLAGPLHIDTEKITSLPAFGSMIEIKEYKKRETREERNARLEASSAKYDKSLTALTNLTEILGGYNAELTQNQENPMTSPAANFNESRLDEIEVYARTLVNTFSGTPTYEGQLLLDFVVNTRKLQEQLRTLGNV